MTPAYQVLLCLCLLGLSFAAPQSRNIRWCVTSDTEVKKCNDLEKSCSVTEIAFTCVKKPSTEECMRAISNGEADAMSLNNEHVYKASLNPLNLKPIMAEGHSQRAESACIRQRQEVLSAEKPSLGAFLPECDEKGDYSPKQCHVSTGYCWCVTKDGKEIAGTRTGRGEPPPTCGATDISADPPCLKERQKMLQEKKPVIGRFIPQCDEKGNYKSRQCHSSTGYCWCVNADGKEIAGTKNAPGQPAKNCASQAETACVRKRQEVLSAGPLPGAFLPDCDENGDYSPKQCHGSTGYCWCANKDGTEIGGTRAGPGQSPPTCGATIVLSAEKACVRERQKVLSAKKPVVGAFQPDCDENGDYRPKQCHGSTGYCWCANKDGKEIEGTRAGPGQPPPTCGATVVLSAQKACVRERQKVLSAGPLPGAFQPDCDENGDYSPKQCHGSTGYCWCANKDGKEIEGTRAGPGQPPPTCGVTVVLSAEKACVKERQKVLSAGPLPGAFQPDCDENGDYSPKQCHGSIGYCWCANKDGKEIAGTRTGPGQSPPTCGATAEKACVRERQEMLSAGPSLGAFLPDCDEKGDYSPKQCHGSTGYCWCANKDGKEIEGTRAGPGQPPPTCGATADTPCLKERQKMLGEKKPVLGRFVPQCDEKGNYSPQQCHGSTGYCWCVNVDGKEIAGTKTPPGQPAQNCEPHATVTPCLKERRKQLEGVRPLIGRFIPGCDEKGNYSPQQCHGSTGYCWCVNADGKEIAGTKTPPGQPAQNCEAHVPLTCHYAVAVVKKSSTFQFNQLKGKRSCHSAVGETAGWTAPMYALLKKKLLMWDGPENKSFEKVVAGFFSASCAPGAKEANLCKQCAGQQEKCKPSPGEPYFGDAGALRCLKDGKGDVAFVTNTELSGQNSNEFELMCPDNTRRLLSQHKDCNFGKVPTHAVVTRRSGDKAKDIIEYLLEAQKKQCKLFDSTHGHNLLFEDTTTSLISLPSAMDTPLFLRPVFNALKTLHGAPLPTNKEIRWCPQSKNEKVKCDSWAAVSGGAIKCTEPSSAQECIEKILKGEADVVTVGVEHMYAALRCGLVPAVEEYHNKDDFVPCQTRGAKYTDFGTLSAVALVKKKDKDLTWENLAGKKSCHTGVGHQAGWVIPNSLISKKAQNCDLGSYFSQSCAPGSAINSNLCKLCIGDPQNKNAGTKCSPNDKEAYYGNEGAVRCLVEKGDVAFVPHTAVFENTDGKNPALWAKDLKSTDFELLCPDGTRAAVSDYKKCKLSGIPPRAVITRPDSLSDVVRITLNQQSLYGRKGFQKDIFQMFSSSGSQNLLFSDGTQCLIEFDRMIEKDIMDDYFGNIYYTAIYKDNHCLPVSALVSACTFHHC